MLIRAKCSACGGRTSYFSKCRNRLVQGWGQLCSVCWQDLGGSYPFTEYEEQILPRKKNKPNRRRWRNNRLIKARLQKKFS